MNTVKLLIKLFIRLFIKLFIKLFIRLFIITTLFISNAYASASSSPWTMPVGAQFFKKNYFNDYELPLIDPLNDTATNLSLIQSQKSGSKNINSEYIYWTNEEEHSTPLVETTKELLVDLKYLEDIFNKSKAENKTDWLKIKEPYRILIQNEKKQWIYSEPSPCGNHENGVYDFNNFIQKMDLSEQDKATYLIFRIKLSIFCDKATQALPTKLKNTGLNADPELKILTSQFEKTIGSSKLKERISDYLVALAESYANTDTSLPEERQLALLKTNIDFIKDSFTYYVIRVLSAQKSNPLEYYESESSADAPLIILVKIPTVIKGKFDTENINKLWQTYIAQFPKGRFIKSAVGLLRRHAKNYTAELEKFLNDPISHNLSYLEYNRIAEELEPRVNITQKNNYLGENDGNENELDSNQKIKLLESSPILFTIKIFQGLRLESPSWQQNLIQLRSNYQELVNAHEVKIYDYSEKVAIAKTPMPDFYLRREGINSLPHFYKEFINDLDSNKSFNTDEDLRVLIKSALYYYNNDLDKVISLNMDSHKSRKSVYFSFLRYKAWALEEKKNFPEALKIWQEIKNNTNHSISSLVSMNIPILENQFLSGSENFNWNNYTDDPVILSSYVVRFLPENIIMQNLRDTNVDSKLKLHVAKAMIERCLVTENWNCVLEINKLNYFPKDYLSSDIWNSVSKLNINKTDPNHLLVIGRYLLFSGKFFETYLVPFGTIPTSKYVLKPMSAGSYFTSIVKNFPSTIKSDVEAEALSHISKCRGRDYSDKYCYLASDDDVNLIKTSFKKLHSKYKGSKWAKETKYFF